MASHAEIVAPALLVQHLSSRKGPSVVELVKPLVFEPFFRVTGQTGPRPSIWCLDAELRLMIYKFYFKGAPMILGHGWECTSPCLALLDTCKQIRNEALPLAFKNPGQLIFPSSEHLVYFLSQLNTEHLQRLRHIYVRATPLGIWVPPPAGARRIGTYRICTLASMLQWFPGLNLETLTVHDALAACEYWQDIFSHDLVFDMAQDLVINTRGYKEMRFVTENCTVTKEHGEAIMNPEKRRLLKCPWDYTKPSARLELLDLIPKDDTVSSVPADQPSRGPALNYASAEIVREALTYSPFPPQAFEYASTAPKIFGADWHLIDPMLPWEFHDTYKAFDLKTAGPTRANDPAQNTFVVSTAAETLGTKSEIKPHVLIIARRPDEDDGNLAVQTDPQNSDVLKLVKEQGWENMRRQNLIVSGSRSPLDVFHRIFDN